MGADLVECLRQCKFSGDVSAIAFVSSLDYKHSMSAVPLVTLDVSL